MNLRQFGPCASAGNNRQSDAEASGPVPVPADRDRRLHESTPSAGHRFTSRYHAPAEVFCGALEVLLNKAAETESIQINRLGQSVAFDRLLARLFRIDRPPWALEVAPLSNIERESLPPSTGVQARANCAGKWFSRSRWGGAGLCRRLALRSPDANPKLPSLVNTQEKVVSSVFSICSSVSVYHLGSQFKSFSFNTRPTKDRKSVV